MDLLIRPCRNVAFVFAALTLLVSSSVVVLADAQTDVAWAPSVNVSPQSGDYGDSEFHIGQVYMYALSYVYDYYSPGPVYLFRSSDGGLTWSATIAFDEFRAEPSMCVYANGSNDEVLLVSAGNLYKSEDNGQNFYSLSALPLPIEANWWRFMGIGTNASWFGSSQDSDVYVAGGIAVGIPWEGGAYHLAFVKSRDGGSTWSDPVIIGGGSFCYRYPKLVSDGSSIYVVYSKNNSSAPNYLGSDLYAKSSSDWGMSWSAEKKLFSRGPVSDMLWTSSVQYLDGDKAFMTICDSGEIGTPDRDPAGRYGYFHYSDMSFEQIGYVNGPTWNLWGAFAGRLKADNTLCVVWNNLTSDMTTDIKYTYAELGSHLPSAPSDTNQLITIAGISAVVVVAAVFMLYLLASVRKQSLIQRDRRDGKKES
jgi:hypothetical protein